MRFRVFLQMLAIALVAGLGCASGPEPRSRVSYRASAKENFIKGKKALEDEDYLEAIEYFKFVKNKFPYSSFATESDLFLADCQFERERYIEAADAYLNFIKLHPKNAKAGYAMFRIGMSFFKRIPEDWWFAPPAYELDQKEIKRAVRELERFLARFPDDENTPEATKILAACKRRMAERVRYAMVFYHNHDRHRGALWRAEQLLKSFPEAGFAEEALLVKAESLLELGESEAARSTLSELLQRFPSGEHTSDAEDLLNRLQAG